jgi:hypothetical protein
VNQTTRCGLKYGNAVQETHLHTQGSNRTKKLQNPSSTAMCHNQTYSPPRFMHDQILPVGRVLCLRGITERCCKRCTVLHTLTLNACRTPYAAQHCAWTSALDCVVCFALPRSALCCPVCLTSCRVMPWRKSPFCHNSAARGSVHCTILCFPAWTSPPCCHILYCCSDVPKRSECVCC